MNGTERGHPRTKRVHRHVAALLRTRRCWMGLEMNSWCVQGGLCRDAGAQLQAQSGCSPPHQHQLHRARIALRTPHTSGQT